MSMRLATAQWANPDSVANDHPYQDGSIWLGRSTTDVEASLGYRDDRHVCLVSGTRGGKGTSSIVNTLLLWPGSVVVVDPKGENATLTAARRGRGAVDLSLSASTPLYALGLGQEVLSSTPSKPPLSMTISGAGSIRST